MDTDKISVVVGPGGKTIRGIIESSGVESVDVSDDGSVSTLPVLFAESVFDSYCYQLLRFSFPCLTMPSSGFCFFSLKLY